MEQEPSNAPLGPFFEAVRRRHPDVDLIVLPDVPEPPPAQQVDDDHVAAVRRRVGEHAARWWSAAVANEAESSEIRIRYGPVDGTVVVASRHVLRPGAASDSLSPLVAAVRADGGLLRETPGVRDRWSGALGDLRVRASRTEARGLLLEVESQPVQVGHRLARELTRR